MAESRSQTMKNGTPAPTRVAIACQGGGSRAAFAAGVLQGLLSCPEYAQTFSVSALTGTSGGALCAGLAWSRLISEPGTKVAPADGGEMVREKARGRAAAAALRAFWEDLACEGGYDPAADDDALSRWAQRGPFDLLDTMGNFGLVQMMRALPGLEGRCTIVSGITRSRMLELFDRHLPVALFEDKALDNPSLRIGATNVLQGYTDPLAAEGLAPEEIHAALLASASIPPLFDAAPLKGRYYWDGLFSHNPPIDCLTNLRMGKTKKETPPDEIWVIQINPDRCSKPPTTMAEIIDRRNELSGNLALAGELYHIDAMNWLLDPKNRKVPQALRDGLHEAGYQYITLRVVGLQKDLGCASGYDRSRAHIEGLMELGRAASSGFFAEGSKWTCYDHEGVHMARVQPGTMGRRGRDGGAPQCRLPFCTNRMCPLLGFCNTWPAVGQAIEDSVDFAQKRLEFPRSDRAR